MLRLAGGTNDAADASIVRRRVALNGLREKAAKRERGFGLGNRVSAVSLAACMLIVAVMRPLPFLPRRNVPSRVPEMGMDRRLPCCSRKFLRGLVGKRGARWRSAKWSG